VADATVGVMANPMSGRDIRRLVASASVFPNAEKAAPYRRPPRLDRFPNSLGCVAVDDGAAELAEEQES
jgi:predicted polyphosphate/ATP-dependent NAD kinase